MTARCLRWSLRAYRSVLIFYPEDLRREFGLEMLEAFADDLAVENPVRVWRITLRELIHIGLPAWLRIPAVAVPALSAATLVFSQSPLLIMSFRGSGTRPLDALVAVGIETAVTALTSFVAVHRWKRTRLVVLDIGRLGLG
jgi:hypothetical protein